MAVTRTNGHRPGDCISRSQDAGREDQRGPLRGQLRRRRSQDSKGNGNALQQGDRRPVADCQRTAHHRSATGRFHAAGRDGRGQPETAGMARARRGIRCIAPGSDLAGVRISQRVFQASLGSETSCVNLPAQISSWPPWVIFPTGFWAWASAAKYQCSEFVHKSILLFWIVVHKILLQSLEELPLSILLALQAEPDQG